MAELLEELNKIQKPKHRHKLVSVLAGLHAVEKTALEIALRDPLYSSEGIARALRASGTPIGSSSVKRFRRDVLGMTNV